jgi:hypothetical protein
MDSRSRVRHHVEPVAELRSFIIGVTIAGAVLLFAGLAFGLFGDDNGGSPSVRFLGTPPATRTPPPAVTRAPSEFTPVPPTSTPVVPAGETPGAETAVPGTTEIPIQTATPTLEVAPTAAATATPEVNTVAVYVDTANLYTPGIVAQIDYLIGNVNAPNITSAEWRSFTTESAQAVQGYAASLAGVAAPACVAGAHGSLVTAANQASASAGEVITAVNANNGSAATAASVGLSAARDAINNAVANVSNTIGSSC